MKKAHKWNNREWKKGGLKKDKSTNLLTTPSYFVSLALRSVCEMVRPKESANLPAQSSFSDSQASCSNTSCLCSPQLRQCPTLLLLSTSSVLVLKHAVPIGKMQNYTSRASYKHKWESKYIIECYGIHIDKNWADKKSTAFLHLPSTTE